MLTLNLKEGGKVDLPPECFLMLEQLDGGGCQIIHNLIPNQNEAEQVSDQYGFMKKRWQESVPMLNLMEVSTVGPERNRKVSFPEQFVIARRELTGDETGAQTRLTLNVNGAVFHMKVVDDRDSLIGEADAQPEREPELTTDGPERSTPVEPAGT